jgi:hypothetical protein
MPGLKPAGAPDPAQDYFGSPGFQYGLQQDILNRRDQNRNQQAYNQIARNQSATDQARLGLDMAQFGFSTQNQTSSLLSQLLGQAFSNLQTQRSGAASVSDLASRLLDTRHNIQRSSLLDQLRLIDSRNDLNRIIDTPQSRARRLIGG